MCQPNAITRCQRFAEVEIWALVGIELVIIITRGTKHTQAQCA